jgi:MFS family permease
VTTDAALVPAAPSFWSSIGRRQLDRYPDTRLRYFQLGLVVLITVVLYYQNYVPGGVGTEILRNLHMSFTYFVTILAISNLIGALGSLLAGLADRFGRANLVVYGLLITGVLMFGLLPHSGSKLEFGIWTSAIGLVEGVILVATPALIRDYSPQVGRATAMGFWTMGPVLGSLVVSEVAVNTLPSTNPDWQGQYLLCGVVGLITFALAFVFLRELSPSLRDQLMVSTRETELIEARAKGLDIEESLRNPFRQMLHPDIVLPAFAVAVLLLIYYTAVVFGTVYYQTVFQYGANLANSVSNWNWGTDAVVLLVVGVLSDRLRVRKPFMLAGGIGVAAMIVVYLSLSTRSPSATTTSIVVAFLAACLGLAYAPWMASFTETVEARNPALTATGLAIWGLLLRLVVFASFLIIPHVVATVNPLVEKGPQAQAYIAEQPALVHTVQTHQKLFEDAAASAAANHGLPSPAILAEARQQLGPNYLQTLTAAQKFQNQLTFLSNFQATQHRSAKEWQHWYWVCFGGAVVFVPMIFLMKGRWSPRLAKRDSEEHDREIQAALARLHETPAPT